MEHKEIDFNFLQGSATEVLTGVFPGSYGEQNRAPGELECYRLRSSTLSMASGAGGVCIGFRRPGGVGGYGMFVVVGGVTFGGAVVAVEGV